MLMMRFLIALLYLAAATPAFAEFALLPEPLLVEDRDAGISLRNGDSMAVEGGGALDEAAWIASLVREHTGLSISAEASSDENAKIRITRPDASQLEEAFEEAGLARPGRIQEAYRLRIGPDGIVLDSGGPAGRFYGLTTLWQILTADRNTPGNLPGLDVFDAPEFPWRGLMLDSARHMQSVGFIKRYLDWMSLHKLNVFHWHLTDDQAWRLEIKAWPKLAKVGGYRVPAGAAPAADIDPETGKPRLYGGYYSQEDVIEIVRHATARHITVVPEIDVPGHATAAIAAYPELGVDGFKVESVSADWGIFDNVFNLEESTFEFLETVLAEVVSLFPSTFIHLGGDEVSLDQWQSSKRIALRMEELGIKDFQSLQNYYVERLQIFLDQHDRRVIGWDEILESDLPPRAAVMSWRGIEGAVEAAEKGHQAVLSPAPVLYLDHIQTSAADAPPGRGGVITTRDIYEFDVLPETLAENREYLLGVQANLWTEHVRTEDRAAYMTWPRAVAVSELGWSAPGTRNWDRFAARLPAHVTRLQKLGIPAATDENALYGKTLPGPTDPAEGPVRREDRELELCSSAIVLALEDDAPLQGAKASFLVDIQNPCWIWRNADLAGVASISASVGQLPFNFQIGDAINSVVVESPAAGAEALLVKLGACDGPVIATLPLAPAIHEQAVTRLPAAAIEAGSVLPEEADLCFIFTRKGYEPIWAIDWVQLEREGN
jgi:hexosaminidase